MEEEPIKELTEPLIGELVEVEEPTAELLEESKEEPIEELEETPIEATIQEPINNHKKIILGIILSFCTLLIIYLGMTKYFTNHFYFGSKIHSIDISGKTVDDAKKVVASELQNYTLKLKERGAKSEQIKGSDVGLKYTSGKEFNKLKNNQNPFKWILAPFTTEESYMTVELSYDEKLLKKKIDTLSCFNSNNIVEPKNPSFQYQDHHYVIIAEVLGTKVDKDILYSHVVNSILKGKTEIDLESAGCYINPQYNSKSKKIIEVKDLLNKYASSKITYTFGQSKEILDGSIINKWLTVDDKFQISLDKEKVKAYIKSLAKTYDTVGKKRKFTTSLGNTIEVDGGDYGWSIDRPKETQNLIQYIEQGKAIIKQPVYSQTAFSYANHDIGNTYVEINLAKQHLWFYKNGSLIAQGNVVTGNVARKHSTPKGIYKLKYKARNVVLRGPGYAAPVTFWMPFNGGIGIHDANWRSVFGGTIYLRSGSHGCINAPYRLAKVIFNNIQAGTPVICYK